MEYGVVTQCLALKKLDDQYLTNVLLKINAKVCGAFPFIKTSFIVFCVFVNCQFECILLLSYFFSHQLGGLNSFLEIERNQAIPSVEGSNHYLWYGCFTWCTTVECTIHCCGM